MVSEKKVRDLRFSERVNPLPVKRNRSDHGAFNGKVVVHKRDMCLSRCKR